MKWTKFKDGLPEDRRDIYETDYEKIWVRTYIDWEGYAKDFPENAWAEIRFPELPKEKEEEPADKPDLKQMSELQLLYRMMACVAELKKREAKHKEKVYED